MTQLVALHSVLVAGRESEYDAAHVCIPDDLMDTHRRAGMHDWQIWRSGMNVFHIVTCDDFDEAMNAIRHDAANERWQAFIGEYVDHFERDPNGGIQLESVWSMGDQAGRPPERSPGPLTPLFALQPPGPEQGRRG